MTRKLIGRPCELVSVGAMAPSIEQYAGALPVAATHRGEASVTPATGSPIDATGIDGTELRARAIFSGNRPRRLLCRGLKGNSPEADF